MRLALVTDAWAPQINGVVRTLSTTVATLRARGHVVETITPDGFTTIACPTYPEIRLALGASGALRRRMAAFVPDAVHIATEGPLGWAARRWCLREGMPFTTSFHTRFPDYVAMRTGLSPGWFWPVIHRFHAPARRIMVATETLRGELAMRGLGQTHIWSRGVDFAQFGAAVARHPLLASLPRPIQLYVGRVAVEKNIAAFLDCPTAGTKVVVGDGPALDSLRATYRQAVFLGALHGAELAAVYASANVFVFPSLTDTFGLVMIEALASGTPVAGFPVSGPLDVIGMSGRGTKGGSARIGCLSTDLRVAIEAALTADRAACEIEARSYSWERCTDQFMAGLVRAGAPAAIWRRDRSIAGAAIGDGRGAGLVSSGA